MKLETTLERSLLAARWLLVPMYAILLLILAVFAVKVLFSRDRTEKSST